MEPPFQPFAFPDSATVTGLRLIHPGDAREPRPLLLIAAQFAGGELSILAAPVGTAPHQVQTLAVVERDAVWDATPDRAHVALVSSMSGSAISALVWQAPGLRGEQIVNRHNDFGVFGAPRFVKGDMLGAGPTSLTSVAIGASRPELVLFTPESDGGYSAFRVLPNPTGGELLDALMIRRGTGYLLVTKTTLPGLGRPKSAVPGADVILPGRISCILLTADTTPEGVAWQPFASHPVYEFDAVIRDGRLALFATVAEGAVLSILAPGAGGPPQFQFHSPTPLRAPAILSDANALQLAILTDVGLPSARILTAEITMAQK